MVHGLMARRWDERWMMEEGKERDDEETAYQSAISNDCESWPAANGSYRYRYDTESTASVIQCWDLMGNERDCGEAVGFKEGWGGLRSAQVDSGLIERRLGQGQ